MIRNYKFDPEGYWKHTWEVFQNDRWHEYSTGPSSEGLYWWDSKGVPHQELGNGQFSLPNDPVKAQSKLNRLYNRPKFLG